MKKYIFLLFLLPAMATAQWYNIDHEKNYRFLSVAVDPAMALYGSDKNPSGLNYVISAGANHNRVRVAVFYEQFHLIRYQSWGVQPSLALYPWKNVQALVGTEVSMINRYGPTFISYALNAAIEFHFKRVYIGAKADLKRRPDITQKWGYSNYIRLGFKF